MQVLVIVFLFVIIVALGPLAIIFSYLHLRRRAVNKRELQDLQSEISRIKEDISDMKEQIADFIIKTG